MRVTAPIARNPIRHPQVSASQARGVVAVIAPTLPMVYFDRELARAATREGFVVNPGLDGGR